MDSDKSETVRNENARAIGTLDVLVNGKAMGQDDVSQLFNAMWSRSNDVDEDESNGGNYYVAIGWNAVKKVWEIEVFDPKPEKHNDPVNPHS